MRTIEGEVLAIAPMMRTDDGKAQYLGKPMLVKAESAYGYAIQVNGRMVLPEEVEYDMLVAPLGVLPANPCWVCGNTSMPMATTAMCMRCVRKAVNE
mgnify:FL=1